MIIVAFLTHEEILTLEEMHENNSCHAPRIRAHAILLSHAKFKLSQIAHVYSVCRQTVSTWIHAWETKGICGLLDQPRSGRPRILRGEAETDALNRINQTPRSLKKVLADLSEHFGLTLSLSTLKRVCKRAGLSWKRVRKSLKSKRNADLFEQSQQQLMSLIKQSQNGEIDLFYFDESGVTLEPCVPYPWQPIGETIEVPSSKSKRLNVLGFMDRECSLTSIVVEGRVTSAVVVASIDHFITTLQRPTALIIDNAPVHTSHEFKENIERWKEQDLTIIPIAPYSPELNIILITYETQPYFSCPNIEVSD
jgi:transposase